MKVAPTTRTNAALRVSSADRSAVSAAAVAPFERIKQHLKGRLAIGDWAPGALMPSEAELVAQFGVSRMTVNRALRELQLEGLVDRVKGVGTFAAQLHRVSSSLTIRDIHEEILARGHTHHATVSSSTKTRSRGFREGRPRSGRAHAATARGRHRQL